MMIPPSDKYGGGEGRDALPMLTHEEIVRKRAEDELRAEIASIPKAQTPPLAYVHDILLELRAMRDATPCGELRSTYNAACDRVDVLYDRLLRRLVTERLDEFFVSDAK